MKTINQIGVVFCTDSLPATTTDRVRAALDKSGLDAGIARDLAKRYCFTRAKNHLREMGLIDEVVETEARWTWQLSKRYREENRLGYEFEASFWYDKLNQTVGADNLQLLERVQELFARNGALYLPSDITKLVRRVFDAQKGMVPLRHHGVVYFVPQINEELVTRISTFISEIGGECISAAIGQNSNNVRDKALAMLVESVRKDLGEVVAEMQAMNGAAGGKITARKARNRWKELLEQVERIKTFAVSLSASARSLMSQVSLSELDLALVAQADLDVVAALAHAGKINGALGAIAKTAYAGELPAIDSPRVQAALPTLDLSETRPVLPVVRGLQPALAGV